MMIVNERKMQTLHGVVAIDGIQLVSSIDVQILVNALRISQNA